MLSGDRTTFHQKGPVIAGRKCMFVNDQTKNEQSFCMNLRTRPDTNGETYPVCVAETKKGKTGMEGGRQSDELCLVVFD